MDWNFPIMFMFVEVFSCITESSFHSDQKMTHSHCTNHTTSDAYQAEEKKG